MECLKQEPEQRQGRQRSLVLDLKEKGAGLFQLIEGHRSQCKDDDMDHLCQLLIQSAEKMNYFKKQGGVEVILARCKSTRDLSGRIEELTKIHLSLIELLFLVNSEKVSTHKNYTRIMSLIEALEVKFFDDVYVLKFLGKIKLAIDAHVAKHRDLVYFKEEILKHGENNKRILETIDRFETSISIQFQETYRQSKSLESEVKKYRARFILYLVFGIAASVVASALVSLLIVGG